MMTLKIEFLNYLLYHISHILYRLPHKIMRSEETIKYIKDNNLSVSRYGDGEFGIMRGHSIGFQDYDPILANRLKEICKKNIPDLLICVPGTLKSCKNYKSAPKKFWKCELGLKYHLWNKFFKNQKILGDTQISRFYIDFVNGKQHGEKILNLWMELWNKKNILIVEGKDTKLGVGNNLFSNANSIKRIIVPSKNAFYKYSEILNSIIKYATKDQIILLAVGPTATILAMDLSIKGLQAIDIGHIDIEYEWYLKNAQDKIAIPSKAVNEVRNGLIVTNENIQVSYNMEIIKIIE